MTKFFIELGGLMAQAVRRSLPTAGVPCSRLGHSMWVSWWTKRGQGRFLSGFSPVFPYHKFHSTISPLSHLIHFVSFHQPFVMVRQAWSAGTLATHGPIILGLHRISSHDPTLCWTRVEDIYFIFYFYIQSGQSKRGPVLLTTHRTFTCSPKATFTTGDFECMVRLK